jgi:hypothetical protein
MSLLAVAGLRFVHLEADTPASLESGSMAVYVDEGYKTLGPRNLALFGSTRWNTADTYPTWMKRSPLTQWLYLASFELLGVRPASARVVTIAFFVAFLLSFLVACWKDYSSLLLVAGVMVLGVNHLLFFYSRLALFELPLIAILYGLLFVYWKLGRLRPARDSILVIVFLGVAALGVKPSALAYFGPVVLALLVETFRSGGGFRRGWALMLGILLAAGAVAMITRTFWVFRVSWNVEVVRSVLLNPLSPSSGLLVAAGLLCVVHLGVCRPKAILEDSYRLCLASLIVLGPVLLAFVQPSPERYWVPLLPAYFLFVWEWLGARAWRLELPRASSGWTVGFAVAGLSLAALAIARVLDPLVRVSLGGPIGPPVDTSPLAGAQPSPRFLIAIATAVILGTLSWRARHLLGGRAAFGVVLALLGGSLVQEAMAVSRFLLSPSYRSREIAAGLESVIADSESVAGDWAPFFALGTDIRALYMTSQINHPYRIDSLRPDYFLFCDSQSGDGRMIRRFLEESKKVQLGPVLFESDYVGADVILYRLGYPPAGENGSRPRG